MNYTLKEAYTVANDLLKRTYPEGEPPIILEMYLMGSRYININTTDSDYDITAIVLPNATALYKGEFIRTTIKVDINDGKDLLEIKFLDIRDYIKLLTNSNVTALQMVYARTEQRYVVPFNQYNSLRAEEVQDFLYDLRSNQARNARLFNSIYFFNTTQGRIREHLKSAEKAYNNKEYKTVIKHCLHVDYLVEIIHTAYNNRPIRRAMHLDATASEFAKHRRETATEKSAKEALALAILDSSVFEGGTNQYCGKFYAEADMGKVHKETKALNDDLKNVMLGGYTE